MVSRTLTTDAASVASSTHTHSTDLNSASTITALARPKPPPVNPFPSIRCNLGGIYADCVHVNQNSAKLLKKLNFVVCSERTLEIFESEKTYRKKKRAKTIVDLAAVYSITKRANAVLEYCLMLVTAEQTFYLRAPTQVATNEWFVLLSGNIRTSRSFVRGRQVNPKDSPDTVWDVNVTQRPRYYRKMMETKVTNLVKIEKRAQGHMRLCFFPNAVILLQMHTEPGNLGSDDDRDPQLQKPDSYFYFLRPFISFYGCQHKYFFIKTSTATFGTCEVFMECDSVATCIEIYKNFEQTSYRNVQPHDMVWKQMFNEHDLNDDDGDDDYYRKKEKKEKKGKKAGKTEKAGETSDENAITALASPGDSTLKRLSSHTRVVQFDTAEEPKDEGGVISPPEPLTSIDNSDVGSAINADLLRIWRNEEKLKKKAQQELSKNAITGFITSIKRRFHHKPSSSAESDKALVESEHFKDQTGDLKDLKEWAENRTGSTEGTVESRFRDQSRDGRDEETEDSGGTLKVEDLPTINPISPLVLSEESERIKRRDQLFSTAVQRYKDTHPRAITEESIEMADLSSSHPTDDSSAYTSNESSSCAHSMTGSDADSTAHKKAQNHKEPKSSTSALDSCISNTSEDFSASSSVSNVEYTWKPAEKASAKKKDTLDTHSCAGRYANLPSQTPEDVNSDLSVDSCYSSLTNHGCPQSQILKSHSMTQFVCKASGSSSAKSPPAAIKPADKPKTAEDKERKEHKEHREHRERKESKKREVAEPVEEEEEEVAKPTLRPNKSSNDLMSDVQQEALRSVMIKPNDPESLAAANRQRAASLGNKSWAITPLDHTVRRHRHRQDCRKKRLGSSTNTSVTEERPLLDDFRHSSISSQSEQSSSHRSSAAAARARLAHALFRKNPRRTEDMAEVTFMTEGDSSLSSINDMMMEGDRRRETVQVFDGTNRALIPTTRYSDGSSSSTRNKMRRARRQRKSYELDVVECYLDPKEFEKLTPEKPKSVASVSSRESIEEAPQQPKLCRHGRPRRQHNTSSGEHKPQRKHVASCQDAIAEEECTVTADTGTAQSVVETRPEKNVQSLNSSTVTNSDDDRPVDTDLDRLNNNPNPPVSILA